MDDQLYNEEEEEGIADVPTEMLNNISEGRESKEVAIDPATQTIHSVLSDDEYSYSDLEGTQYDSDGSYRNAIDADNEEEYYSVDEDEYGFRIPEFRAM